MLAFPSDADKPGRTIHLERLIPDQTGTGDLIHQYMPAVIRNRIKSIGMQDMRLGLRRF